MSHQYPPPRAQRPPSSSHNRSATSPLLPVPGPIAAVVPVNLPATDAMAFVAPVSLGSVWTGTLTPARRSVQTDLCRGRGARTVGSSPPRPARPASWSMKKSPGFLIKNDTIWPLQVSLNQVSPLYYGIVQPGETFERTTGAVWFTIKASVFFDEKDRITAWDAIFPIASIVGTVVLTAVTAGAAAYAAGPAIAAAGGATGAVSGATVTGLSSTALAGVTAASTQLVGAGFSAGAALSVGGAIVGGGGAALSATGQAALKDIFSTSNTSVSKAGVYAGPPWPFRNSVRTYHITGGPIYRPGPVVNGEKTVELVPQSMRVG